MNANFKTIPWERVVLDEAHNVCNVEGLEFEACNLLSANHRWVLTGTPVINGPNDLFAMFRFLRLPLFGEGFIHEGRRKWNTYSRITMKNKDNVGRFNLLLSVFMLRRMKNDLAKSIKLGEKQEIIHRIELENPTEQYLYKVIDGIINSAYHARMEERMLGTSQHGQQHEEDVVRALANDDIPSSSTAAYHGLMSNMGSNFFSKYGWQHWLWEFFKRSSQYSMVAQMRLLSIHFNLFDERLHGKIAEEYKALFDVKYASPKIKAITDLLEQIMSENGTNKCVVFSQWYFVLQLIGIQLEERKIDFLQIDGTQQAGARHNIRKRFESTGPKSSRILLLTISHGNQGLNLQCANHLIFCEPNSAGHKEIQAENRIHRIGQLKPVKIHRFFVVESIEERMSIVQKIQLQDLDSLLKGNSTEDKLTKEVKELIYCYLITGNKEKLAQLQQIYNHPPPAVE